MGIPAQALGRTAGDAVAQASARRLMAFAAGIGADDPCYFDDLRPEGIVGHPAFCASLEWPVVSGADYRAALGRPAGGPRGTVHVQQDSHFHRPIRSGEALRTSARVVQIRQTGAGALVTCHIDTLAAESGEKVVTSWSAGMFLREKVDGVPAAGEEPPALRADAAVATAVTSAPASVVPIQTEHGLAHRYTECADIWNPIHTELSAAKALGLPAIILHGTCTWALAGQELIRAVGGGDPRKLRRLAGRFKAMVFPGDRLSLEFARAVGSAGAGVSWQFAVRTPRGDLAITHGVAEFDA